MIDNFPKVRFFGRAKGLSGYSQATKFIAQSFSRSNVPVYFSSKEPLLKSLSTCSDPCDIDFYIHTPPFSRHKSSSYKIGYFYWEADRLPVAWERDIKACLNEIWVPCELTKTACRKAGFTGPIEIVHTPRPKELDFSPIAIPAKGADNLVISDDTFVFYSIFQWNERKGYRKLFRAYLEEFSSKENVVLVVKTNPINHRDHGLLKIKQDLMAFKRFCRSKRYPDTYVITDSLSEKHLEGLHDRGDCFVLPHHGEGWGMPIHDAMAHGSLILTTKYGGVTDHLSERNSLLIKHKEVEVRSMNWNSYYGPTQRWADPDLSHLKLLMRRAYEMSSKERLVFSSASQKISASLNMESFSDKIERILSQSRFSKIIKRRR